MNTVSQMSQFCSHIYSWQ